MGNDLAEGKLLLNPEVTAVPLSEHSDDLQQRFQEVFTVCPVIPAMSMRQKQGLLDEGEVELADRFMANPNCLASLPVVSPPAPSPSVVTPVASASSSAEELSSKVCKSQDQLNVE